MYFEVAKEHSKCKHHSSIWDRRSNETSEPMMMAFTELSVINLVVMAKFSDIKSFTLLNTTSGSSYSPVAIVDLFRINLARI